jgi:transketolase
MAISTQLGYDDLPGLLTRLTGDEKHDWSSLSTLDVLWVLYDRVLGEDDRFLLSKGHGPTAYFAVLAAKGIIPLEMLDRFGAFDSPLGHGLAIGVGRALAGRRVFVLVGDGELDEGSNWEAVQYAGRAGLENLTAVVIDNDSATHRWPGGIEARFALEGWNAVRVDGRDHDATEAALRSRAVRQPRCVVAEMRR